MEVQRKEEMVSIWKVTLYMTLVLCLKKNPRSDGITSAMLFLLYGGNYIPGILIICVYLVYQLNQDGIDKEKICHQWKF